MSKNLPKLLVEVGEAPGTPKESDRTQRIRCFRLLIGKANAKKLIGVIIVEGAWTQAILQTLAKIFDYVGPLSKAKELAEILKKVQDGDESVLKWLIQFLITPSPRLSDQGLV